MSVRTTTAVEQLERVLLLRILEGDLKDATELPSRVQLSQTHGVSSNTVGAAVGRLVARGLCEVRWGTATKVRALSPADREKRLKEIRQGGW